MSALNREPMLTSLLARPMHKLMHKLKLINAQLFCDFFFFPTHPFSCWVQGISCHPNMHKPARSHSHVNTTFPKRVRRYKHRLPLKRWLFFCFSPWVVSPFMLRACQSLNPPTPTPNIPTSSLSVVDADMSHLEALPYMCCIDISLLTFPFPGGLKLLHNSSGLMNAFMGTFLPLMLRDQFSQ